MVVHSQVITPLSLSSVFIGGAKVTNGLCACYYSLRHSSETAEINEDSPY